MTSSSRPQADSLVADIGGTNTRIARAEGPIVLVDTICSYRNADYQDFTTVLEHYMATAVAVECRTACVAVAGLVHNGTAELTNLDWRVDTEMITRATGASTVVLLNDLQAKGHSLGYICPSHLREIIPQPNVAHGATQLVIGIGTGFNAAVVYHLESGRLVAPAEAGHINMPIANDADLDLAQFIAARNGFADVEDVASGRGIEQIYTWLGYSDARISSSPVDEIIQGLAGADPHAEAALRIFVRLFAISAGNLALTTLPLGGIYLAGGVARAVAPHFIELGFTEAFRNKGRFSDFMDSFGVSVIEDDYAALTGCARHLAGCH